MGKITSRNLFRCGGGCSLWVVTAAVAFSIGVPGATGVAQAAETIDGRYRCTKIVTPGEGDISCVDVDT